MTFLKKQWPLIGLAVLLCVVALYVLNSPEEEEEVDKTQEIPPASGEGLKLQDIQFTQEDPEGEMKWTLDAREVNFTSNRDYVVFQDFRIKMEPKDRPTLELEGEEGEYSRDSGEIELRGDLKGSSERGYKIAAEQMCINEKTNTVTSEAAVKIFGDFFSVEGKGLFADLKKEKLNILSDVTMVITKEELLGNGY